MKGRNIKQISLLFFSRKYDAYEDFYRHGTSKFMCRLFERGGF